MTVPQSAVTLRIAADSLRSLPQGASYSGKSGQAGVKVSRVAPTSTTPEYIYVYATCDSLQLLCEEYEKTILRLRKSIAALASEDNLTREDESVSDKPSNVFGRLLKAFLAGLLAGIIATLLFIFKIKK